MAPNVTDWIDSTAGVLTLVAAVAAGVYAKRAAHWTKAQAEASDEQVRLAEHALEVARGDAQVAKELAERQRQDAVRAARRLAEERVDAMMPTVLVTAMPGIGSNDFLQIGHYEREGGPRWHYEPLDDRREYSREQEGIGFAVNVTFRLQNLSTQIAQVAVSRPDGGQISVPQGQSVLVRPGETKEFTWTKFLPIGSLRDEQGVNANGTYARVELIVQDLGINAYDRVEVLLEHRFFSRDGSRLVVEPQSAIPWREAVGIPLPGRVYARLDDSERPSTHQA